MYNNNQLLLISGPCSLESVEQIEEHFQAFPDQSYLRAGIYKMRTSSENFQGLREEGIKLIKTLKQKYNFKFVSEVVSKDSLKELSSVVDIFQVGTRNMYNYELLKELNKYDQPIILKRGFSATLDEFIEAAKYIHNSENRVMLCERGIRTFETKYRNTLDINAVSYLKHYTNYKVIVDPSHGVADPNLILPISLAAVAAGADGLLIETHYRPIESYSDAHQALSHNQMQVIIEKVTEIGKLLGKEILL